ncbi:MAG TPA: hypothetical protein PKV53_10860 [Anaerohalosphaeraceae bacterium]|nr:hypothetical protein [Phycisphaerae bacterium]HPO70796.1 hypothetical protein [Anaerohalosphaeraceae bacterium]
MDGRAAEYLLPQEAGQTGLPERAHPVFNLPVDFAGGVLLQPVPRWADVFQTDLPIQQAGE